MTTTPNLDLPYLAAGQAQKHVTLNESLRMLDALLQLSVVSRSIAAPPATPAEGARYLLPASPSGGWSGQAGRIAAFQDGGWAFYAPNRGWLAWVEDEDRLYAFDGAAWVLAGANASQPLLGVNTTADTTNRLAVSSPASLFNHAGAGHQLKLNKASAGETASLLFQTGFSGRAEIGLAGDDSLRVKLSADGTNWNTLMQMDPGNANLGVGLALSPLAARLQVEAPSTATGWFINTGPVGPGSGAGLIGYCWGTPLAGDDRLGFMLFGSRGEGAGSGNAVGLSGHAEGAWAFGTAHPAYLRFDTTAAGTTARAERMRITASGKVGIGVSNPGAQLDVAGAVKVGSYPVAGLPSAAANGPGAIVFVANESGGAVLAFSDGTNWRRVTDRAVVS